MAGRITTLVVLGLMLLILWGCDGGDNYFGSHTGEATGPTSLDIAGSYSVVPDTFGFNSLSIYQNGNSLTAQDNGGGTWSGTLTNVTTEEKSGTGGTVVFTWRGDVTLAGKNTVGDDLSLIGPVEITTGTTNTVIITADYENVSIGLTGQLVLTRVSATPGAGSGTTSTDGSGNYNK
jgi:hypothetical protein